jgi:hypothetical protein
MRFSEVVSVLGVCIALIASTAASAAAKRSATYAVHPLCVQRLAHMSDFRFQSQEGPLAPADCNRLYSRVKVESSSPGWFFADEPNSEAPHPYYGYRVVGQLDRKTALLEVNENTGGTGIFSAIVFVSGWPQGKPAKGARMETVGIVGGGDRCQGTVGGIEILSPDMLRIDETITPAELFSIEPYRAIRRKPDGRYEVVRRKAPDPENRRPGTRGTLADGPPDCLGSATFEYDLAAGTSRLVSISIGEIGTSNSESRGRDQKCLNGILRELITTESRTFTPSEVKELGDRFERECLTN